jgi:predicted dehydrogenase
VGDRWQPTSDQPGVVVLGCGRWGRNLVRVLGELGALRCVVDPEPRKREDALRIAGDVQVMADAEAGLRHPGVDAAVIATPAETHFELGRAALRAGLDVLVEKPLTTEAATARVLCREAREADRLLMVGHLLEYHPGYTRLLELVREGALGKLFYVISNRVNLGTIRTEENALWSFAPHDIAVILRLLGAMPFQVVATGGNYIQPNIADVTVTQLLFDNGVRSHVFVSWLHPFKEQRLVVVGSDRMASYDDVSKQLLLWDQRVGWSEGRPIPLRSEAVPVSYSPEEPLQAECRHFLTCVRERRAPLTDGESGVRVLQVLEAAQRSLVMNGHPVSMNAEAG